MEFSVNDDLKVEILLLVNSRYGWDLKLEHECEKACCFVVFIIILQRIGGTVFATVNNQNQD